MYQGPSCPDHCFPAELDDSEINTWIRGILAHGVDQNFGSDPVPLREGVESPWVSLLELSFLVHVFASQCMHILARDFGYMCSAPWGVTLPEEAARWEVHRAHNEWLRARRQRRQAWSAPRSIARAWGEETPSEPESLGGDEEEEDEDEEEG
jgi:hypothetical protein